MHACMLSRFSHVWFCATPWTSAHQAPLSMGFSRQEYWSGLPFPSPTLLKPKQDIQQESRFIQCVATWEIGFAFFSTASGTEDMKTTKLNRRGLEAQWEIWAHAHHTSLPRREASHPQAWYQNGALQPPKGFKSSQIQNYLTDYCTWGRIGEEKQHWLITS